MKYIVYIILLISVLFFAFLLAQYASKKLAINRTKVTVIFIAVSLIYTLSLLCFFGVAVITVRGLVLLFILMYSSSEDIKTRNCDDYIHLMIVIAAFIGTEIKQIPIMILSGVFVMSLMLITLAVTKGEIGGADIKLSAACSFLLGIQKGLTGLLIGLVLAIIINLIKAKDKKAGFPLIPYLAVGFLTAYFI